jgi:Ca2+-binding RTX toxin-like protein
MGTAGARTSMVGALTVFLALLPAGALAAPANDNFAARTTIPSLPYEDSQNTADATNEPSEPASPCGRVDKTVWYQFTPPTDVVLRADTLGSDYDTILGVWSGSDVASLAPVACSDDAVNVQSIAVFSALGGTTYLFQVGGYAHAGGALQFRVRPVDAATVSGTVTDEPSGLPLSNICVDVVDADFLSFFTTVTDGAGVYRAPVRQGSYKVVFYDWCDQRNDHRSEWYHGKPDIVTADEVAVTTPAGASGVDASLGLSCPGFGDFPSPQFIGTAGPDVFTGTDIPEIFCGFGGGDRIRGGGSRDRILGGDGSDRIWGSAGSDYLFGGAGSDRIAGGADNDFVSGGDGRDRLGGGPGHDRCDGGRDRDRAARSCEGTNDIP